MKSPLPETAGGWVLLIAVVAAVVFCIRKVRRGESSIWVNALSSAIVVAMPICLYVILKFVVCLSAPRLMTATIPSTIVSLCLVAIGFLWTRSLCGGRQIETGFVGVWLVFGKIVPLPSFSAGPVGYVGWVEELPAPEVMHEFKIRAAGSDAGIPIVLIVPKVDGVSNEGQVTAKVKIALRFKVRNPSKLLPQLQLGKGESVCWAKHKDVAANLIIAYILDHTRGTLAKSSYTDAQKRDYQFNLGQTLRDKASEYGLEIDDLVLTDVALNDDFAKALGELADEGVEKQTEKSDLSTILQLAQQAMEQKQGTNGAAGFDQTEALLLSMMGRTGVNQSHLAIALAAYGALKQFRTSLQGGK